MELIERRARLERRHGVDEIGDRFGLHQIDAAVEKRAQRELARLREPRAVAMAAADDRLQDHRAAMRADLDDVVSRVGMRGREEGDDDLVDGSG